MKTSQSGIDLIKKFEGCRLKAYKPVKAEKYWTIGWGHYGPDVTEGMMITQAQADVMLVADLGKYENYVIATGLTLTQNQFDALVSFTYNCGPGNLSKLVKGRDYQQIADAMLLYNKDATKKPLAGLTRRRTEERALFLSEAKGSQKKSTEEIAREVLDGLWGNGAERRSRLTKAGYNYIIVQREVNRQLKTR